MNVMNVEPNAEREEAEEEEPEEGDTPVVIPSAAVTIHPKREGDPIICGKYK